MRIEEFLEFSEMAISAASRGDHKRGEEAAHKLMDQSAR